METIFDWLSVLFFGCLSVTFLQRSVKRHTFDDPIWTYLPPVIACVSANWLGNEGYTVTAFGVLGIGVLFALKFIWRKL